MKKILLAILTSVMAFPAIAELTGDGYYRVQNAVTKRYAYLLDDKGSVNMSTTSADVRAIELWLGFEEASSDPSTVFYLTNHPEAGSSSYYDIAAQGTSLHSFFDSYMKVISAGEYDGKPSYYAYAQKSGMTKYLGDLESDLSKPQGFPSVDAKGDNRKWYLDRISSTDEENYFGIATSLSNGGKYYQPFYADFPFTVKSAGVKVYVVDRFIEGGAAVMRELSGCVPARTAVIFECEHSSAADNRIEIGYEAAVADVSGNKLAGVFFDNPGTTHYNRTPYDKSTMRMLAVKDGKLNFVTSDIEFLPRNQAYLQVGAEAANDVRLLKEDEVQAYLDELQSQKNKISAITFDPQTVKVERGESLALNAVTTPAQPSNPGLTWTTSDASVASVYDGVVTGLANGTCTITATSDNGVSGSATIVVVKSAESVTLDITQLSLASQETAQLTATLLPEDVTETALTWESSDQNVAVVSEDGLVRARFPGDCQITVTTTNGLTAICSVNSNSGVAEVTIEGDAEVYDLEGHRVASMQAGGVYIVVKDGRSIKIVM